MSSVNVGVLGLGEAGSAFAAGMAANGATVRGFDPAEVAGDEAEAFVTLMSPVGLHLTAVSPEPGVAATRKLLRSVLVKGLSALIIESMRAAGTAGEADWFSDHVFAVLNHLDREYVIRLVEGNVKHSVRRVHEMEAASELLRQLGEPPLTSEATRQVLESVPKRGVPAMQDDRPVER